MARKKRTRAQIAYDLVYIEERALKGITSVNIAKELNEQRSYTLSRHQIDYDLRKLERLWQFEARELANKAQERALAEIKVYQRECYAAWERSQLEHQATLTEKKDGKDSYTKAQVRKEQRVGDKAFLTGIQWCIEQRLKIFGVYAAQKVALTWEEEAREQGFDPEEIVADVREFIQDKEKQTDA